MASFRASTARPGIQGAELQANALCSWIPTGVYPEPFDCAALRSGQTLPKGGYDGLVAYPDRVQTRENCRLDENPPPLRSCPDRASLRTIPRLLSPPSLLWCPPCVVPAAEPSITWVPNFATNAQRRCRASVRRVAPRIALMPSSVRNAPPR